MLNYKINLPCFSGLLWFHIFFILWLLRHYKVHCFVEVCKFCLATLFAIYDIINDKHLYFLHFSHLLCMICLTWMCVGLVVSHILCLCVSSGHSLDELWCNFMGTYASGGKHIRILFLQFLIGTLQMYEILRFKQQRQHYPNVGSWNGG